MRRLNTEDIKKAAPELSAGERILLSGTVYTARDAAHKRIFEMLDRGEELPFDLENAVIYYAGPTGAKEGMVIGSCGPTTSGRMDGFAPRLYDLGLAATIGKGERSEEVFQSICRNKAVYLCAIGGAGALMAKHITENTEIAFPELGCESIKRLKVEDMPLTVAISCDGGNIFKEGRAQFLRSAKGE